MTIGYWKLVFCFSSIVGSGYSATILAAFSSLNPADHCIFRGYVELLSERGHSVIMMTPFPGYSHSTKVTVLSVAEESRPFLEEYKNLTATADDYLTIIYQLNDLSTRLVVEQLRSQTMTSLLVNPLIKFDLVITEADMPLLYALAEEYRAPHIAITAGHGKINMYDSKGNPNHCLLYPDVHTKNLGKTTMMQKMTEMYRHLRYRYVYYYDYLPKCNALAKKMFGFKRDLIDMEYDIDLLFVSGTHMLMGNRPTVPAIVYLDQMHFQPGVCDHLNQFTPSDKMNAEINEIMDRSTTGVLYISFGATQEVEILPTNTIQAMMDAFEELPYTVLWKMSKGTNVKKPNNVIIRPWFPQQQILAHQKLKAFITPGGARSLEEAMYYQVPIVGIPVVAGQKVFIEQMIKFGVGKILEPAFISKKQFKDTVFEVANEPKYKDRMSYLRDLAYDLPMSGPQRALWWTEYVIRHGGAKHLRAPAVGTSLFYYFMLDLVAIVCLLFILALWLTVRLLLHFRSLVSGEMKPKKD